MIHHNQLFSSSPQTVAGCILSIYTFFSRLLYFYVLDSCFHNNSNRIRITIFMYNNIHKFESFKFGSEADCTFASICFGIPPLPAPTSIPKATTLLTASGPRQGISIPTSPDILRERCTIFNHKGSHPKSRGWPKKSYF